MSVFSRFFGACSSFFSCTIDEQALGRAALDGARSAFSSEWREQQRAAHCPEQLLEDLGLKLSDLDEDENIGMSGFDITKDLE